MIIYGMYNRVFTKSIYVLRKKILPQKTPSTKISLKQLSKNEIKNVFGGPYLFKEARLYRDNLIDINRFILTQSTQRCHILY